MFVQRNVCFGFLLYTVDQTQQADFYGFGISKNALILREDFAMGWLVIFGAEIFRMKRLRVFHECPY